ncbi:bypass of stop codon protein 1-like [Sebastes umbrosus]|uniref:bypass of stop codon protein 1-like n=1 Tax=Sebastes umbrosus TaxID=72105 RepID=UPI00189E6D99|nr:bypass of stop codon protein 1-like [Sebastes umbrosus]
MEFKTLEANVVAVLTVIYRTQFGAIFIRIYVIEFRQAVARTRMGNTELVLGIEFNQTASASEIPQTNVVAETLVDAVSNNSTSNLLFVATSIEATQGNVTTAAPSLNTTTTAISPAATTTTSAATTATTTSTTTAAATTASTTTATAATTTTTTTTTTTSVTTTAEAMTTRRLIFRSAGETFTSDLQNPSSAAFTRRASIIKTMIEPLYQEAFPSFRTLMVLFFSNGSIINHSDLTFLSTSVPNGTQIIDVLVGAASNITAFNIDTTSISVDGIQVSSGVSHKIRLITASFLVLLSWLLSSQQ